MMKTKIPICLIAIFCSLGLMGQATMVVDGFARFEENLTLGTVPLGGELYVSDTDNNNAVLLTLNTASRDFITGVNVSSGNFYGTTSADKVSFITDDVVRMILTPEGFLGIGTPGPSDRLHVRKDGVIGDPIALMVLESSVSKIPTLKFDEGDNLGMGIQYDGTLSGDDNKMHILNTIGNKAMTITNGGKVGIRETDPEEALEVDGQIVVDGSNGGHELRFYDGSNLEAKMAYNGQILSLENSGFAGKVEAIGQVNSEIEGSGDILLDGTDSVLFFTDVNTKGFLSSAGRFGINQNNPSAMLHVRAFGNTGTAVRMENDNNNNHWSWRAKDDLLEFQYNGVVRGYYNGADGQYTVVSDKRLKENIKPIKDGVLENLHRLEASEYYFKSDVSKEEKSLGFIAQDVYKVFPSVVSTPETEEDYYGIRYGMISVLTIKALQEQQKEIDYLENEIQSRLILKEKLDEYRLIAGEMQAVLNAIENSEVKE